MNLLSKTFFMLLGYPTAGFHWLIGGDGNVYEGYGWEGIYDSQFSPVPFLTTTAMFPEVISSGNEEDIIDQLPFRFELFLSSVSNYFNRFQVGNQNTKMTA